MDNRPKIKTKKYNIPRRKHGHLGLGDDFLDITPKAQGMKKKKRFSHSPDLIKFPGRMKRIKGTMDRQFFTREWRQSASHFLGTDSGKQKDPKEWDG